MLDRGKVLFDDTPDKVFEKEDELNSLGLGVPQSTALAHKLRESGMKIGSEILTPEKCAEEILKQRKLL